MPCLKLINEHGRSTAKSYPLTKDSIIIGRSNSADVLIHGAAVSSRHAQIRKSDGLYMISDLSSKNGTSLNNQPLSRETHLSVGDRIRIGETVLVFMDEATESGSGFIGTDDSVFKGTMVKAEQLAHSMVADDTRGTDSGVRDHLPLLTEMGKNVMGSQNEQALAEMLTKQLLSWFSMDHLSLLSHIANLAAIKIDHLRSLTQWMSFEKDLNWPVPFRPDYCLKTPIFFRISRVRGRMKLV